MQIRRSHPAACVAALAAGLVLTGYAGAVAPEIKDEAKFFKPEVVKKANADIREIMRKYGRDLLIETFPTPPGDKAEADKVKAMSAEERTRFFQKWATERATDAVVNGVYILVCKEPAHVRVVVTPKAHSVFDKAFEEKLSAALLKNFREKQFDEGLQEAVRLVREKLASSAFK